MPDTGLHLLAVIILRLEEARLTRQAELRLINQHIERLEELRDQRIRHVRQRIVRDTTSLTNQEQLDIHAPDFLSQDIHTPDFLSQENNTPDEDDDDSDILPELERVDPIELATREQAWIEERGIIDAEEANREYITRGIIHRVRRRTQPRAFRRHLRPVSRTRGPEEPTRRPHDFNQEQDADIQITAIADAIAQDILQAIVRDLRTD